MDGVITVTDAKFVSKHLDEKVCMRPISLPEVCVFWLADFMHNIRKELKQ